MIKRTFTREFMEENEYPWDLDDEEFLFDSRWANHFTGVFEFEGATWQVQYQKPATEYQECDPWYDDEEIEALKVVKLPVVKYEWTPVSDV